MTPFSSQLTCIQDLFRLAKGPSLRAIKLSPYEPNGAEFLGSALFSIASFASKLCLYAYPIYLSFQVALQRATPGAALRQAANFVTLLLSVTALSFFLRGFGRYSNPNYRRFYENFLKIKGHPLYKDYIFDINYVKPDFSYTENAKVLSAKNSGLNIIYSMIARFLTDNLAIYLTYPASTDFVKNVDLPIDLHAYSLKLAGQSSSIASMDEYIIGIANNIQLNLFHFQSKMNSSRKLVVYFTGNGENALKTQRFKDFTDHGYDFVVYDRPGYGISSGKPVPQNEANSVLAVMKFVTSRLKYDEENIVIYGWSIGGFSASIAYNNFPKVQGIILDATFESIAHFGLLMFPPLLHPVLEYAVNHYFPLVNPPYYENFRNHSSYLNVMVIIREKDEVMSHIPEPEAVPELSTSRTVQLALDLLKIIHPDEFESEENFRKLKKVNHMIYLLKHKLSFGLMLTCYRPFSFLIIMQILYDPKLITKAIYAHKKNFLEQCISDHVINLNLSHAEAMDQKDLKYILEKIQKNHKRSENSFSL